MTRAIRILFLMLVITSIAGCVSYTGASQPLKINDMQVIGSHNSYKEKIHPELLVLMQTHFAKPFLDLQYGHPSLTTQLEVFGLRNLEIDVLYDPKGGLYSQPLGQKWLKEHSGITRLLPNEEALKQPGFKVLHKPDVDFETNCATLTRCLSEIKRWSDEHPQHLPIAITFNLKTDNYDEPGFVTPLAFDTQAYALLDAQMLEVLGKNKLITPDDVRGAYSTLNEAVLAQGWPTLGDSRGKFILVLDEGGAKREAYIQGHPSLKERVMFVNAEPGADESAFLIMNQPVGNVELIKKRVKAGYLVRTRADAATIEARENDYTRFHAAKASGAQFITTDYYTSDASTGTDYQIRFPQGDVALCNLVTTQAPCIISE